MRSRVLGVLLLVLAVVGLPTPTAVAESSAFPDGKPTAGPMDIHRVVVVNEKQLQIRVFVDDLQRRGGRSAMVWIDKNPDRAGPEYWLGSGLYDSDWQIARARNWQVAGNGPLNCPVDQRLLFKRDVIVWTTGSGCLGKYSQVRVSVETWKGGVTDYSPMRHRFHDWVPRG